MIRKLELKSFKGKYAKAHEAIFTNQMEMHLKINEIIEAVNSLGKTIDDFTGTAPEYRD